MSSADEHSQFSPSNHLPQILFTTVRRLLEYFGEVFSSSECKGALSTECDNCRQEFKTSAIDCTRMASDILKLSSELNQSNSTLPYIIDILRGANSKHIRDAGHHRLRAYSSCQQLSRLGKAYLPNSNISGYESEYPLPV